MTNNPISEIAILVELIDDMRHCEDQEVMKDYVTAVQAVADLVQTKVIKTEDELWDINKELDELKKDLKDSDAILDAAREQHTKMVDHTLDLEKELEDLREEVEDLEAERDGLTDLYNDKVDEYEDLCKEYSQLHLSNIRLENINKKLEERIRELQKVPKQKGCDCGKK